MLSRWMVFRLTPQAAAISAVDMPAAVSAGRHAFRMPAASFTMWVPNSRSQYSDHDW